MDHQGMSHSGISGLKRSVEALKNSSLGFMQVKTELAAIEAKEALSAAKKKVIIATITAFFGFFSYVLLLILIYGMCLQLGFNYLTKISNVILLNEQNVLIMMMFILHLSFFFIYLIKLIKRPHEEFFALTKSEFQKDKQWLTEINKTYNKEN